MARWRSTAVGGRLAVGLATLASAAVVAATAAPAIGDAEDGTYELSAPVFDIDAAPGGGIVFAEGAVVKEIRDGQVRDINGVVAPGSSVNGVHAVGSGTVFAAVEGLDLAMNAAVWKVTRGTARKVADIGAYEASHDPDAFAGPQWKDQRCEEDPSQGFSAGPQSNPYHLVGRSGSEVLVADAAGNTLLSAKNNGAVELVAVFTPPKDENGDWRVLFTLEDGTDCYVQPVPTAADIAADGAVYVGELTGAPATPGWSRVWRIEPGAENVTCPSAQCDVALDGLTSVIDVAFGPDGTLYVVEYDSAGWLAAVTGSPAGGSVKACDLDTGTCSVVAQDLELPGALTFDAAGNAWLLEDGTGSPTVRRITLN